MHRAYTWHGSAWWGWWWCLARMLFALADTAGWIARTWAIFRGMVDPSATRATIIKLWNVSVFHRFFLDFPKYQTPIVAVCLLVAFQIKNQYTPHHPTHSPKMEFKKPLFIYTIFGCNYVDLHDNCSLFHTHSCQVSLDVQKQSKSCSCTSPPCSLGQEGHTRKPLNWWSKKRTISHLFPYFLEARPSLMFGIIVA